MIVGTVGGGTGLPTQRACLEIMGLAGAGHARAFAEVAAALALAGELSITGALAAGHFTEAHRRLSRGPVRSQERFLVNRWIIYQRERFPLAGHAPLVAAFSVSAVCFSRLVRGEAGLPDATFVGSRVSHGVALLPAAPHQ